MRVRYFEDKAVDPPRMLKEIIEFRELFYKFLTNDWVHTERKISALDAQMKLVLAMLSVLVGLMVYMVIE